jgi:hypothetical protein
LVQEARALGSSLEIIDRCNLSVLCEPGQEDLPRFLAQQVRCQCVAKACMHVITPRLWLCTGVRAGPGRPASVQSWQTTGESAALQINQHCAFFELCR